MPKRLRDHPLISVVIPARNEEKTIEGAIAPLLADPVDAEVEVIVADGRSSDGTRDVIRALAERDPRVRLVDNPPGTTPEGLNAAIRASRGDVIIRMDGHSEPDAGYLAACLAVLRASDAWNAGGQMRKSGSTRAGRAASAATTSPFGVGGGGRFHLLHEAVDTDTVWLGAWPRWAFEQVGLFDPELGQDQDEELNQRIIDAGGRVRFDPSISALYVSRASWDGLLRQYFRYGLLKVRAIQKRPRLLQPRHLVSGLFIAVLVLGLIGGLVTPWPPVAAIAAVVAWLVVAIWYAQPVAARFGSTVPEVVAAYACLHLGYGLGMWAGLVRYAPRWIFDRHGSVPVLETTAESRAAAAETPPTSRSIRERPLISVILAVRNEEATIERAITPLLSDPVDADLEVVVADGASSDRTREVIESIAQRDDRVRLVDNGGRFAPDGLNVAIRASHGDVLVRMDGHSEPDPGYLAACLAVLHASGAWNVGGRMRKFGETPAGRAASAAASSPFGIGGLRRFHLLEAPVDTDTVWLGCWPRWVFERIGLFDPELVGAEDEELNQRIIDAGGRIRFDPSISASYVSRGTWATLIRQYFRYGMAKVRIMQARPSAVRLRHFVPAAFVAVLVLGLLGSLITPWAGVVAAASVIAWLGAAIWFGRPVAREFGATVPTAVAGFACLHIGYGVGMWTGLVRYAPRWLVRRHGKVPVLEPTRA